MKRRSIVSAFVLAMVCFGAVRAAHAKTLFSVSGQVAMADGALPSGVHAKLQLDLNRNGSLESYETLNGTVGEDGSYSLDYDLNPADVDLKFLQFATTLIANYNARGFEALLDNGPLPVLLSFEREGYSTVVKRLNTWFDRPNLDVMLTPLRDVQCAGGSCLSPDGAVWLSGFPGGTGIARGYANAYDPSQETARFPGLFTDSSNNLLISSGFAEINLYDDAGNAVHNLASPVAVRFEAQRPSWSTMPDLEPNSGRIGLPMYSFDQVTGEWVAEANGELQLADGSVVSEEQLGAIRGGTFSERVFVAFETKHFSTFNCDAPIRERACVKGRLVASGSGAALAGIQVSVQGVSYTGGAGAIFTGADGTFAADLMKSELPSEDVNNNGKKGELYEAHVVATGTGVYVGAPFETPTVAGSVGNASRPGCRGAACDCVDLGDIVVEFEPPRMCEITIEATFSGKHLVGSGGPLAKGDAVVGAKIRAQLAGGVQLPDPAVAALCETATCGPATAPASGTVTFAVPVIGATPQLKLDADFSIEMAGALHYYAGSLTVDGCVGAETALTATAQLQLDHAELNDLGSFIQSLGNAPQAQVPIAIAPPNPKDPVGRGCGCQQAGGTNGAGWASLLGALSLAVGARARRRALRPVLDRESTGLSARR